MKTVEEASAEVLAAFEPVGEERVTLLAALGRFSVRPIIASHALPPFDNSAMDGYAVRAADLAQAGVTPLTLPVLGESRAGGEPPTELAAGTALRIFTGAPLAPGADAVELQENVTRAGAVVQFSRALELHANVRRRGSDVAEGALALPAHSEIGPGEIALLASQELPTIDVFRRPRVAILCTGDELREIGERARPGSIINSNAYALAAQTCAAGAEPWLFPPVRDRREDVAAALRRALRADVVVLSGGVSVGDYDVVREGLADAGITLGFWKVQMKPGKPLSFARHGALPILGLPGNPVSAWLTFELFVRPGLRKMLGDPAPQRERTRVSLARALRRRPGRTEFARARLTRVADRLVAELLAHQSSGALASMVGVDALLEIPAECAELAAGAELSALLLRGLPR